MNATHLFTVTELIFMAFSESAGELIPILISIFIMVREPF